MELYIQHGRATAEEDMDDWGFDGPRLQGVKGIHVTYLTTFNVHFETPAQAQVAKEQTGWENWDENALEMRFEGELLKTKDGLFGDWGLM